MSNCLTFSVKYRLSHKNSKIYVENHIFNIIKEHGFKLSILRYMRYIGFVGSLMVLFLPHFYVIEDGVRYDYNCFDDELTETLNVGYDKRYDIINEY